MDGWEGALVEVALIGVAMLPFALLGLFAHLGRHHRFPLGLVWGLVAIVMLLMGITLEPPPWSFPVCLALAAPALFAGCRRRLWDGLPLDPADPLHTLALYFCLAATFVHFAPLLLTGHPPVLQAMARGDAGQWALDPRIGSLVQLVWMIPVIAVLAGWGTARSLGEVATRLGLHGWGGDP